MNNIIEKSELEESIINIFNKALSSHKLTSNSNEWMTLKEGAKFAGVCYNTFVGFREMGLKVSEVNGVKRVSRKAINQFLESNSF